MNPVVEISLLRLAITLAVIYGLAWLHGSLRGLRLGKVAGWNRAHEEIQAAYQPKGDA